MGACISYTWYTAKEIPFTPELHRTFAAGCGSTRPGNSLRPVYTSPPWIQELAALWETEDKGTALRLEYRIKQLTRTEKERLIHEGTAFSQLLPQLEVSRYRRRPGITLEMCLEGKIDA